MIRGKNMATWGGFIDTLLFDLFKVKQPLGI